MVASKKSRRDTPMAAADVPAARQRSKPVPSAQGLSETKREVARLSAELDACSRELDVFNAIQQGAAAAPDFQAIIELVGDRLRTMFNSENVAIAWREAGIGLAHMRYVLQDGERVYPPPVRPDPNGRFMQALLANLLVLANNRAEMYPWVVRCPRRLRSQPCHAHRTHLCQRHAARRHHAGQPRPGTPIWRRRPVSSADRGGEHGYRAGEPAHRCNDGQRDVRRPRGMPVRRHGRLRDQAHPCRCTGRSTEQRDCTP